MGEDNPHPKTYRSRSERIALVVLELGDSNDIALNRVGRPEGGAGRPFRTYGRGWADNSRYSLVRVGTCAGPDAFVSFDEYLDG